MHRAAAVACLTVGILLLVGPGWALVALGIMVWILAPRDAAPLPLRKAVAHARALVSRMTALPRRSAAVASMAAGTISVPVGMLLLYGAGAAVLTAGAALIGVSLLTGWNA